MIISQNHRRLSIAPMMEYTHHIGRQFLRIFNQEILIYGEMVNCLALKYANDPKIFLIKHENENPVAFQLGGNDIDACANAAKLITDAGFDEINLNCGCPSDAVQSGAFGAVLMKSPHLVAQIMAKISQNTPLPLSVKCRINLDKAQDDEFLDNFITIIAANSSVRIFHIHARNAILKGLSPAQNRTIPPLNYARALRLKQKFPQYHISINGGITNQEDIRQFQQQFDGVMIGRAAFANPYILTNQGKFQDYQQEITRFIANTPKNDQRYIVPLLMALISGIKNGKKFRQILAQKGDLLHNWHQACKVLDAANSGL